MGDDLAGAASVLEIARALKSEGSHELSIVFLVDDGEEAGLLGARAFIADSPRPFKKRPCMIWDEVRECRDAGIEFGSHTVTHPKLVELDSAAIQRELEESKAQIETHLGIPANSFAYPYAFPGNAKFVEELTAMLRRLGYTNNVTTRVGRVRPADNPFTLRRLPVNAADDAGFFMAKVQGAYDWLNLPQEAFKKIKNLAGRSQTPPAASAARRQLQTK